MEAASEVRYLTVSMLDMIAEWVCAMVLIRIMVCRVNSLDSSSTLLMLTRREDNPPFNTTRKHAIWMHNRTDQK